MDITHRTSQLRGAKDMAKMVCGSSHLAEFWDEVEKETLEALLRSDQLKSGA